MSHRKVLELAKKFAEKNLNEQYQQQRERLEEFGYDFTDKLRAILNEMAGDLVTLREKGYDKTSFKQLANLYQNIIELRKNFDYYRPYVSVERIAEFIFSNDMLKIIKHLDYTIQKHLKENEVDFGTSKVLRQAKVESLGKLTRLVYDSFQYTKKHPLLPDVRETATVPPPAKIPSDPEYKPVGNDALTNPDRKIR